MPYYILSGDNDNELAMLFCILDAHTTFSHSFQFQGNVDICAEIERMHVICVFIDMLIECTNAESGNKKYKQYFCSEMQLMNKDWH